MLTAQRVIQELKKCGITHVVWLPDTETRFMYEALATDPQITLVPICREGEALGIALGLWLGGKEPAIIHQNTGFFESGDSVRGLGLDLQMPLLLIIGYRGWRRDAPIVDSAASYLEPILKAWGIDYHLVENDSDVEKVSLAHRQAKETGRPVAVLIGGEYR
ncbi:MAG: hypothetical protein HY676_03310 [Chloroflexi bacterium]|nr:hypothetical protein [Chloroflexota bacterium]